MTTNHDDNGDYALMSGNDPLDSLLRDWHAENAGRAAAQRDQLMNTVRASKNTLTPALSLEGEGEVGADAKRRLREQLESGSDRQRASSPTEGGRYELSLKGEGVKTSRFARFTPAIAASMAFAATLSLLFTTVGPRAAHARADVIMAPDGGRLDAVNARGELIGPCPLKHTDVHVDVSGSFARVTLQQRYGNPYADKIEAVYTFPMSHRAAVDRMTMTIGDRIVVGVVKEREAARATYEAAKSAGHAAALLEQERPNIFTQSVANIEPGVEIVVEISYVELLEARDGLFGFTFPMVVAPRYIPGGDDSSKPLPAGLQHRDGVNLLAPGTLTITANGDTLNNGVLTADVINALLTDALPIEAPPAEYWTSHYPTTGQPAVWHQFEVGYMDGQREAAVLYTDGLGQINGRWFYVITGDSSWPPKAAAMPPGTGFASGTAKVPDAARITPHPVKPPTRAGHDISITVNIDTGGPGITDLKSDLHAIQQNWGGMRTDGSPSQVAVSLNDVATIPNQDFVLHWRQTADTITEQVFTHAGAHGGFITLILNPPARIENTQAVPRELVFVLDTSGSMQGFPIQKAKEVMSKAIAALRPQDTFNLITFAGDTNILWDTPQPASPDKLAEAQKFLDSREGRGGTEMMKAIEAALTVKPEQRQLAEGEATPVRIVCFMTDGEVGNDMAIIDAVKKNATTTRVFSFGIGNSVNRYLLDGIAKAGRGAAEYVLLSEGADEKVASFSQRIQSPVLMDVQMQFSGDIEVVDAVSNGIDAMVEAGNSSSPSRPGDQAAGGRYSLLLPDLYDVAPIIVHARYTKGGKGSVTLRGNAGNGPYEKIIELDLPEAKAEHDVIATLWAREKVEQIMNRDLAAAQAGNFPEELKKQVIDLGETFQIMTQYTSFVAVENLRVTVGGQPRLVPVPIELPEGQSWDGTMGEAVNKWADEVAPQDLEQAGEVLRISPIIPPGLTGLTYPTFDSDSNQVTGDLWIYSDILEPQANGANQVITDKLQQLTGAINLEGVSFEQTINHLRDLSGVNIAVDWNALETAAIEKDKEVSLHINAGTVKMETVLNLLLGEVGGGEVEMASKASNGVLHISTKEALENRITVQTYNVEDLIQRVEEFESKSPLDPTSGIEATNEQELLWQQAEKTYRATEEDIKKAVIDYNFAEARQLMAQSEQTLEANRPYAANAMRYRQFRDHAVQLRRYIDDEEKAHDEAEIVATGNEFAAREQQRLLLIEESKRKQIDSLMGHAIELRKERRYDDAVAVLGQTLAIDPANQQAATMKETLEDISENGRERASASTQHNEALDAVVKSEAASIPWHKDVLYPKNWAEISAKRGIAVNGASATPHTNREGGEALYFEGKQIATASLPNAFDSKSHYLLYGKKKQPVPSTDSRIAGSEQPVNPIGGPESTYWYDVRRTAEHRGAVAGQSTASPPLQAPGQPPPEFLGREVRLAEIGSPVSAAPEEEQTRAGIAEYTFAGASTSRAPLLRAGYVSTLPSATPGTGGQVTTLGQSVLPLNPVAGKPITRVYPQPFGQPAVTPQAPAHQSFSKGRFSGFWMSESVDAPIADTVSSVDLGVPLTQTVSGGLGANTTYDGWDAGQPKSPVLGDIPGVEDAFRITGRGVTLGMPEPHSPDAETKPGAARGLLKLESMTPQKAAELIAALQKDQSTNSPASERARSNLELNSKPLDQLAVDLAESEEANSSPEPTFIDLQKHRTGSNEDSERDYIVKGVEAVLLEAEFLPRSVTLGETARYTVTVTNITNKAYKNAAVNVVLPDGLRLVHDSSYLPLKRMGNRIVFALQPMLGPKARLQWTVRLCGVLAGDHRITAFLDYEGWKHVPTQETESALVRPGPGDQQTLSPEAIAEIDRQWPDHRVMTDETGILKKNGSAADVAQVRPSMRRPGDTVADHMLLDQLLVRTATLARAGRMEASMAVVEAILKAGTSPSPLEAEGDQGGSPKGRDEGVFAVARAMHDVLSSGVLTNDSIISRVCELAADPTKRLAASAERARLMARRLDERLLRLALSDGTAHRTHHASGGPAEVTRADKPPVAPSATAGLDVTDAGVLVSVLVAAFGDGTVAALTKAGLKIESTSKPTRVVIGRIAVKHLGDLATCKHVRRVEAVKVR